MCDYILIIFLYLAAYEFENNCFSDLENAGKCLVSENCGESTNLPNLESCPDGSTGAILTYSEESYFSGLYCTSNDQIGRRPVSYRNGNVATYMIFYCDFLDLWVLTATMWKDVLIEENGGDCGGYKFTAQGSSTGGNSWWEYNWTPGNISFPKV